MSDLLRELAGPDRPLAHDLPEEYLTIKVRLSKHEMDRLLSLARQAGLPEWELARQALRAYGLI